MHQVMLIIPARATMARTAGNYTVWTCQRKEISGWVHDLRWNDSNAGIGCRNGLCNQASHHPLVCRYVQEDLVTQKVVSVTG